MDWPVSGDGYPWNGQAGWRPARETQLIPDLRPYQLWQAKTLLTTGKEVGPGPTSLHQI